MDKATSGPPRLKKDGVDTVELVLDGKGRARMRKPGRKAWTREKEKKFLSVLGSWEFGTLRAVKVEIDGQQVVGRRGASIADPAGGRSTEGEARAAIGRILAALREHGLIEV